MILYEDYQDSITRYFTELLIESQGKNEVTLGKGKIKDFICYTINGCAFVTGSKLNTRKVN